MSRLLLCALLVLACAGCGQHKQKRDCVALRLINTHGDTLRAPYMGIRLRGPR